MNDDNSQVTSISLLAESHVSTNVDDMPPVAPISQGVWKCPPEDLMLSTPSKADHRSTEALVPPQANGSLTLAPTVSFASIAVPPVPPVLPVPSFDEVCVMTIYFMAV